MKRKVLSLTGMAGLSALLMLAVMSCSNPAQDENYDVYGIKIIREDGVTIEQMGVFRDDIIRTFTIDFSSTELDIFKSKISEIHVYPGMMLNKVNNILKVGAGENSSDVSNYICYIILGFVT